LARELECPPVFYILAISQKKIGVLRCSGLHAEVAKLPKVPETLEEALAFDQPDHDLENRSAAGKLPGAMRGIRFGTGSEREQEHGHVADYYKLVDRGLHGFFHDQNIPVILAEWKKIQPHTRASARTNTC